MIRISAILEEAKKKKTGLKASSWCKEAGLSPNVLGNFFKGEGGRDIDFPTQKKLAKAIDLPLSALTLEMSEDDFETLLPTLHPKIHKMDAKEIVSIFRDLRTFDADKFGADRPADQNKVDQLNSGMVEIDGLEFVSVARFDAALSAGPGCIMEDKPEPLGYQLFEAQWLRAVTRAAPSSLAVLQVDGDSMEETLMDDDWVLVDRTQTRLNRTGIYAIQVSDTAWVKRIELDLETKLVQLISDNQRYPIRRLPEEELQVLGRVLWVVGRKL